MDERVGDIRGLQHMVMGRDAGLLEKVGLYRTRVQAGDFYIIVAQLLKQRFTKAAGGKFAGAGRSQPPARTGYDGNFLLWGPWIK